MAISQTVIPPTVSHSNSKRISDDPEYCSMGESSDGEGNKNKTTSQTEDVYEQGTLLKMHKNSVYHKDLAIIPSMKTNEEKVKDPNTRCGGGSKMLSSGPDEAYERVELTRNNSVMIYDVVAPKGQGQSTNGKVLYLIP